MDDDRRSNLVVVRSEDVQADAAIRKKKREEKFIDNIEKR